MKIKTAELEGAALDWAGSQCEGYKPHAAASLTIMGAYSPSTNWAQGGPIIEGALMVISPDPSQGWLARSFMDAVEHYGRTPLVAAMRCYVATNLGDEVEIPDGFKGT